MNEQEYYIYILSNKRNTVCYIGITNDLERRVNEHKEGLVPGFTQKYNVRKLVYVEKCHDVTEAIAREKQLKGWRRSKKVGLVQSVNPLFEELVVG